MFSDLPIFPIFLPQGDQRILLETRGSRRLSSQTLVDLRISKRFSISGTRRTVGGCSQLFDETAEERLATDNFYSPTFGQPSAFVDPRRAMLGIRLNLGQ